MGELLKTTGLVVVGLGCSYAACQAIDKKETSDYNKNLAKKHCSAVYNYCHDYS